MIRGAVYRIDLGEGRRGPEQRGRRYGLALSPIDLAGRVATIVPTSSQAQPAVFRPQIGPVGVPEAVEVAVTRYLDL